MPKISALPPLTTADAADEAPIVDTSATTTKKWTLTLLKTYLQSLAGWLTTAMVADDAITDAKLIYGKLRRRQGGSATNWGTTGTTNYEYSGTDVFVQGGSIALTNGAGITVTFPTAFAQVPIVVASVSSANAANGFVVVKTITASSFLIYHIGTSGSATTTETANWIAIGQ